MCAGGPFQRCFHLRTSSDLAGKLVEYFSGASWSLQESCPFKVGPMFRTSYQLRFPSQDFF